MLDQLIDYALTRPNDIAIQFLNQRVEKALSLSYAELIDKAKSIAAYLQNNNIQNERIILLLPCGLEFIVAFLGCLLSNNIAVPVQNIEKFNIHTTWPSFLSIFSDSQASVVFSISNTFCLLESMPEFTTIRQRTKIVDLTQLTENYAQGYLPIARKENNITHLQYTSGSTSSPKGVIVTHKNLNANLIATAARWNYSIDSITLNWAPHTHVYGLMCGLLLPLFTGSRAMVMSPATFLLNPVTWLKAISHYGATHAGCPNFGYDLCINQIEKEEISLLSLQHWQVAVNGGETVQAATLTKFYEKFKSIGFRYQSFKPSYGMSECTGLIASTTIDEQPSILHLDAHSPKNAEAKEKNNLFQTRAIVNCGQVIKGLKVKIIDPQTLAECPENFIGEIWLSGATCSSRYWNEVDKKLKNENFIRTGDLGFIKNQHIYLVSRLKELLIIHGKNFYPFDIENTVKSALPIFTDQPGVAFTLDYNGNEALCILQGLDEKIIENYSHITQIIRKNIALMHGLDTHKIILVPSHTISKTASGKIQRAKAKADYLNNKFNIIYQESK